MIPNLWAHWEVENGPKTQQQSRMLGLRVSNNSSLLPLCGIQVCKPEFCLAWCLLDAWISSHRGGLGGLGEKDAAFAYSWKPPAYNGAFSLTIDNFSLFTYSWSLFTYI